MISIRFQGKPFNIAVIQVYAPITNAKEAEADQFYKDLEDFLELKEMLYSPSGIGMQKQEVKIHLE